MDLTEIFNLNDLKSRTIEITEVEEVTEVEKVVTKFSGNADEVSNIIVTSLDNADIVVVKVTSTASSIESKVVNLSELYTLLDATVGQEGVVTVTVTADCITIQVTENLQIKLFEGQEELDF